MNQRYDRRKSSQVKSNRQLTQRIVLDACNAVHYVSQYITDYKQTGL